MKKHYVTFVSPGTFVSESTTKPIESWSPETACYLARDIVERYGATPYGFYFTTVLTADDVPDGQGGFLKVEKKEIDRSGTHFLGGEISNYDEVVDRNDPEERILRDNMRGNRYHYIIVNKNSYKSTMEFKVKDVVVDPATGKVIDRGDSPERMAYRARLDSILDDEDKQRQAEWEKRMREREEANRV